MSAYDIDTTWQLRQQLLAALDELDNTEASGEQAAATVELDQSRVGRLSRMDAMQAQAMSQAVLRRRQVERSQIASALRRIEAGDYGYCASCDDRIALARLQLNPATPLCIACAEAAE